MRHQDIVFSKPCNPPTAEQVTEAIAIARELRRVYEAVQLGVSPGEYRLNDIFLESDVIDWDEPPMPRQNSLIEETAVEYRAERARRAGR